MASIKWILFDKQKRVKVYIELFYFQSSNFTLTLKAINY